ncbi:DUF2207 family protein [Pseudomonadota bacterium]
MSEDIALILWFGGIPIVICLLALVASGFDRGRLSDRAITPLYHKPKDLSFLELAMIYDEIVHINDLSLFILDLNFRGHVTVDVKDKEMIIKRLHSRDPLSMFEERALDILFDNKNIVHLDSNATLKRFNEIKRILELELVKKKLLVNTFFHRNMFYGLGYASFVGGFVMLISYIILIGPNAFTINAVNFGFTSVFIYFIILGILFGLTARKLLTRTYEGVDKLREILGLKEFIVTAEKDRIKSLMENERKHYESLLPVAMLFDVENRWMDDSNAIEIGLLRRAFTSLCKPVQYDDFRMVFEGERLTLMLIFNVFYTLFRGVLKHLVSMTKKSR